MWIIFSRFQTAISIVKTVWLTSYEFLNNLKELYPLHNQLWNLFKNCDLLDNLILDTSSGNPDIDKVVTAKKVATTIPKNQNWDTMKLSLKR